MTYFEILRWYYSKKETKNRVVFNLMMHPVLCILRTVFSIYWFVWCLLNHEDNWQWMTVWIISALIWLFLIKPVSIYLWRKHKNLGFFYKLLARKIGMGLLWFPEEINTEDGTVTRKYGNRTVEILFLWIIPKIAIAVYFGIWALLLLYKPVEGGYVSYDSTYEIGEQVMVHSKDGNELGVVINQISEKFDGYEVRLDDGKTIFTGFFSRDPKYVFSWADYTIRGKVVEGKYGIKPYLQNVIGFVKHTYAFLANEMNYSIHYKNDGTLKNTLFSFQTPESLTKEAY